MKDQALLYDSSYCTGCNSCAYKCIQEFSEHALAAKGIFRTIALIKDDGVQKKQCMQCKEPSASRPRRAPSPRRRTGPWWWMGRS